MSTALGGSPVVGLLLAAGAGSRMGRPKALVSDDGGPWLPRSVQVLRAGGCPRVRVVLGAAVSEALPLLDGLEGGDVEVVEAHDWADGMAASLAAGLRSLADDETAGAALVHLVDLPDVGPEVVARLVAGAGPSSLARAAYGGRPGHPVLLGRDHWSGVLAGLEGDEGARAYLVAHGARVVECGDLATGHDVDRPPGDVAP
ncbi:nucleotidyltransferase family protein [Nocardioides nanhaiensis]|uniref:Nucleotidyltransferase family protein n=1 Tax=Nocardioides nanhaiensis TaxID=1476871 RepID=A0ABP8VVG0_9ACTN